MGDNSLFPCYVSFIRVTSSKVTILESVIDPHEIY